MQGGKATMLLFQEIMQDKIYLDTSAQLKVTGEVAGGPPELDLANL